MQELNKFLNIGDKISLLLQNGYSDHQYVSRVENINEDGTIDVLIPISQNRVVYIKNDTLLKVIASKETAIFEFKANVVNKLFGTIPLLRLARVSEVNKIQRRDYFRLKVIRTIKFRKAIDLKEKQYEDAVKATLVDISGGGVALSTRHDMALGDIIEVTMELNDNSVTQLGKIVRKDLKQEDNFTQFVYGVSFEKITEMDRNIILRFIFEEQRKLAKKGLI